MTTNQSQGWIVSIFFSAVSSYIGFGMNGSGHTWSTWNNPAAGILWSTWNSKPVGSPVAGSSISHHEQVSGVSDGSSTLNQSQGCMMSIFFLTVTVYDGGIVMISPGYTISTWNISIPSVTSTWNSSPVG